MAHSSSCPVAKEKNPDSTQNGSRDTSPDNRLMVPWQGPRILGIADTAKAVTAPEPAAERSCLTRLLLLGFRQIHHWFGEFVEALS
jgi:hypothetical protein